MADFPGTKATPCGKQAHTAVTWDVTGNPARAFVCAGHAREIRMLASRKGAALNMEQIPAGDRVCCQLVLNGVE